MLVINSSEFRNKQTEYMDRVDNGEQIIIRRGKNKAYALIPVVESDFYYAPDMLAKINKATEDSKAEKVTKVKTVEELKLMLKKL